MDTSPVIPLLRGINTPSKVIALILGVAFVGGGAMLAAAAYIRVTTGRDLKIEQLLGVMAAICVFLIKFWLDARLEERRRARVASIEEKVEEHPEKPQLAWDLARVKLENYLDRNLSQVKWIFLLTLVVMACGFAFILFGLYRAFDDPTKLSVAIVSSASGVIISFIGGSFLLIYRSILGSAKDYVTVLSALMRSAWPCRSSQTSPTPTLI